MTRKVQNTTRVLRIPARPAQPAVADGGVMDWQFGLGLVVLLVIVALAMVWRSSRGRRRLGESPDGATVWMAGALADSDRKSDSPGASVAKTDDASADTSNDTGDGGSGSD